MKDSSKRGKYVVEAEAELAKATPFHFCHKSYSGLHTFCSYSKSHMAVPLLLGVDKTEYICKKCAYSSTASPFPANIDHRIHLIAVGISISVVTAIIGISSSRIIIVPIPHPFACCSCLQLSFEPIQLIK